MSEPTLNVMSDGDSIRLCPDDAFRRHMQVLVMHACNEFLRESKKTTDDLEQNYQIIADQQKRIIRIFELNGHPRPLSSYYELLGESISECGTRD